MKNAISNGLIRFLIAGVIGSGCSLFGVTMQYSFTSDQIAQHFSSNAYSGNSGNGYVGDGWLGSFNTNVPANSAGRGRPATYAGATTAWQNTNDVAAGIVDFFVRPDNLGAMTNITYSVIAQTSTTSTLFSLGTSGTSGSSTKLLPNYGSLTFYSTGEQSSSRMWSEWGDAGSTNTTVEGTPSNNRYVIASTGGTRPLNTYLSTGSNDVTTTSGTRLYVETLPSTTFTLVLEGASLPSSLRLVFSLWGDQYNWNDTLNRWEENTGAKNTALGFVTFSVSGTEAVPEPGTVALIGAGLVTGVWAARRRARQN